MHAQIFKVRPFLLFFVLKFSPVNCCDSGADSQATQVSLQQDCPDSCGGLRGIAGEIIFFLFGKQSPKSSHMTYLKAHQSDLWHQARAGVFPFTLIVFPF